METDSSKEVQLATIIITNFNYAEYLPQAIDSALAQTYPSCQVIVCDDGSSDGSQDVIRRYENSVEVILRENSGQTASMNAAFTWARGEAVVSLILTIIWTRKRSSRSCR